MADLWFAITAYLLASFAFYYGVVAYLQKVLLTCVVSLVLQYFVLSLFYFKQSYAYYFSSVNIIVYLYK